MVVPGARRRLGLLDARIRAALGGRRARRRRRHLRLGRRSRADRHRDAVRPEDHRDAARRGARPHRAAARRGARLHAIQLCLRADARRGPGGARRRGRLPPAGAGPQAVCAGAGLRPARPAQRTGQRRAALLDRGRLGGGDLALQGPTRHARRVARGRQDDPPRGAARCRLRPRHAAQLPHRLRDEPPRRRRRRREAGARALRARRRALRRPPGRPVCLARRGGERGEEESPRVRGTAQAGDAGQSRRAARMAAGQYRDAERASRLLARADELFPE